MRKQPNDPERTRAAERLFMALSGIDSKYLNECESRIALAQPRRKLVQLPHRVGAAVAAVLCAAVLGAGYIAVQRADTELRSGSTAEEAEIVEEVMPESSAAAVTTDSYAADAATAETDGQQDSGNGAEVAESADTAENAETELVEQPDAAECDLTGASQQGASTESANKESEEAQSYPAEVEEIQAAISQAMADGELPFVTASGIYEDPVRIVVTVNTTDETLIERVKAYDPSGEIIEIVYSDAVINKLE